MSSSKLSSGAPFPTLEVSSLEGERVDISQPAGSADWQMIVVYRGAHCPICTKFLGRLAEYRQRLLDAGIDLAVVSADSANQLRGHLEDLDVNYPVYHGLTKAQMEQLGLYVSPPRSPEETDHDFPEPALFVINDEGRTQVVEMANNPFTRPDLDTLVGGLEFARENDYPIRGTRA